MAKKKAGINNTLTESTVEQTLLELLMPVVTGLAKAI